MKPTCDEYCSTHGCNQSQGCPAGGACYSMPSCKDYACQGHPGVARIGKKMPAKKPINPMLWRVYLKDLARAMLMAVAVIVLSGVVVGAMR